MRAYVEGKYNKENSKTRSAWNFSRITKSNNLTNTRNKTIIEKKQRIEYKERKKEKVSLKKKHPYASEKIRIPDLIMRCKSFGQLS